MAEVVEAEEGAALRLGPGGQGLGLGPGHVGAEPAEPQDRRAAAFDAPEGEAVAVRACKNAAVLTHG